MQDQTGRPDRRTHAWREDLAAEALRGIVEVPRYVSGEPAAVIAPSAGVRRAPDGASGLDTEALHGERVTVFDRQGGWAWVQLARDGYVGYVRDEALGDDLSARTHRVTALATFVYPQADIKTPPTTCLPIGSEVCVAQQDDRFARLEGGGFVVARHLTEIEQFGRDFVDVAERFIGTPYLWGGKTRIGLDCSGLLQLALEMCGIVAPRDSDLQEAALGNAVLVPQDLEGLERGDLVFWPGHVAIMADAVMVVHANAHHMCVAVEPLTVAARRTERAGSTIRSVKRLASPGAVSV